MPFRVPDSCTLPIVERPLRLAEFDALFASAVRVAERVSPQHLRLQLAGPTGLEATVRDLAARESGCCSFFTFSITPHRPGSLTLDVHVPPEHSPILDALAARAG